MTASTLLKTGRDDRSLGSGKHKGELGIPDCGQVGLHRLRGKAALRHGGSKRAEEKFSYGKRVRDVVTLAESGEFPHG